MDAVSSCLRKEGGVRRGSCGRCCAGFGLTVTCMGWRWSPNFGARIQRWICSQWLTWQVLEMR